MSEWVYSLGRHPWHHINAFDLECARRPGGCEIAQISAERWCAAAEDEVARVRH